MLSTFNVGKVLLGILIVMVILGAQAAYADGRRYRDHDCDRRYSHRYHGDSKQGLSISIGPNDSFSIRLGENRRHHDYHRPHYQHFRRDYIVVPSQVAYVQPVPVVVNSTVPVMVTVAANTFNGDDLYMVNVPNDRNGYTSVTIKRAGNGFVGPQGEYYSDFPNVGQLKTMYVR